MTCTFDFVGLNTVISEAFKPLQQVTPASARKAGMEAGIKGTTPGNCHHSYFSDEALETEWYRGYRLGKQNREEA
ncbi:MAG: RlpA-like double-psi beta-barrel domain-containing protein [Granulosicoccus sp.]|nr:RlpA-like double-psi beta-barrel domain-containing protein [Granulosicoccus sp.]